MKTKHYIGLIIVLVGTNLVTFSITRHWMKQHVLTPAQERIDGYVKVSAQACLENLRQIDAAKEMWALENNKQKGDVPMESDLKKYIPRDVLLPGQSFPVCPLHGIYTIGPVGIDPTCSVPGHAISVTR
jgi:hypothetical protein